MKRFALLFVFTLALAATAAAANNGRAVKQGEEADWYIRCVESRDVHCEYDCAEAYEACNSHQFNPAPSPDLCQQQHDWCEASCPTVQACIEVY